MWYIRAAVVRCGIPTSGSRLLMNGLMMRNLMSGFHLLMNVACFYLLLGMVIYFNYFLTVQEHSRFLGFYMHLLIIRGLLVYRY